MYCYLKNLSIIYLYYSSLKIIFIKYTYSIFYIQSKSVLKIDNHKFKEKFHKKATMLKADEVEPMTGFPIGGVCPFAPKDGVKVYLDEN